MTIAMTVVINGSIIEETEAYQERWAITLKNAAFELQKMVQQTLRTQSNRHGENPSPPGMPPHRGRSLLINSIRVRGNGPFSWLIGSSLMYARIQEFGGTIVSKGKSLTVPVSREARRHLWNGGNARNFPRQLFFWHTQSGRTKYLAERKGRKIEVHFMLVSSVTLPPRPFLRPTADSAAFSNKLKRMFKESDPFVIKK